MKLKHDGVDTVYSANWQDVQGIDEIKMKRTCIHNMKDSQKSNLDSILIIFDENNRSSSILRSV